MECQSPYHRILVERKQLLAKYLGPRVAQKRALPKLANLEVAAALTVYDNGVEVGRFGPFAMCPFCWACVLNAFGFKPVDFFKTCPAQAERVLGANFKWVTSLLEGKRIRKRATALERDIRLGQAAAMEVLKQLGIVKEPPEGG